MNWTNLLQLPNFNNLKEVIVYTALIFSIGLIVSTLEFLFNGEHFKDSGLFSWRIWRESKFRKKPILREHTSFIFSKNTVFTILFIRLFLLIYFIYQLYQGEGVVLWIISYLLISQLYLNFRIPLGKDGSDQMSNIVLICLFIMALFPNNKVIIVVSILFIAFQSILSYLTAGIAKLISPTWRSGNILFQILNTKTYGKKSVVVFLKNKPKFVRFLNHGTIAFESLFFLVLFLPYPFNIYFLIIPLLFHLSSARIMGLNSFLFAFLATYPSIIYMSNSLQSAFEQLVSNG